ncbi:MAG: MFS transporter [Sarcina sp.]
MFKFNLYNNTNQSINKNAFIFGIISVFLCGLGLSIIMPIIPFLVQPYIKDTNQQAMIVTMLTAVYSLCVFFAAPGLGALSDRYGRRPLLLICLLGSTIGYLILGIGGALWILFLGRIIDGITGGNISTIFAYFADITPIEQRTKYFGWIGAISGAGVILGPTIGGFLARFGNSVPLYFGALITLLNLIYGLVFMPESLDKKKRLKSITVIRLNPFTQLINIVSIKSLTRLLICAFLLWIPNGSLQALLSQFALDTFKFGPTVIGFIFSIMGIQDIISQGLIMPRLLQKLSDSQITLLGMISECFAYAFIAFSSVFTFYPLFIVGMFIFGFGDSIFGPSFNGIISKSVDASDQGRVQGGIQSIQSLARILGPLLGGFLYISFGHSSIAFIGVILILISVLILYKKIQS